MEKDLREAFYDSILVTILYVIVNRASAVSSGDLSPMGYGKVVVFLSLFAFLNFFLRRANAPMKNLFVNAVYLHAGMTLSKSFL